MVKKVLLYRTETCPWCHKAADFFEEHKVKFTAVDVGEDERAAEEMIEKSGQKGVPVIDIDGNIVVGFDELKLKKLLKLK